MSFLFTLISLCLKIRAGWDQDELNSVLEIDGERQLEDLLVWNQHVLGNFQQLNKICEKPVKLGKLKFRNSLNPRLSDPKISQILNLLSRK